MGFASWQRYCTASAKLCGVEQRAPPMFGRATIRLGIGPHSSFFYFCLPLSFRWSHVQWTDISWLLDLILEGCKPHFKYANGSIRNVLLKHKNTNIAFLCLPSPLLPFLFPCPCFSFLPFPTSHSLPKKLKSGIYDHPAGSAATGGQGLRFLVSKNIFTFGCISTDG